MADFDRYDVCCAYAALEHDWHSGGLLQERPSNQRRRESIGVQLHRMGFKPALDEAAGFSYLIKDQDHGANRAEIYLDALVKFGLAGQVRHDDDIAKYLHENFDADWVRERFPAAVESKRSARP